MNARQSMALYLVQELHKLAELDITQTSAFRFREKLLRRLRDVRPVGLTDLSLELVVSTMQVQLPEDIADVTLEELVRGTAQVLRNLYQAQYKLGVLHVDETFAALAREFKVVC